MTWPKDLSFIKCDGFNQKILPAIIDAIDGNCVQWGECNTFVDKSCGQFLWKNCVWEIIELKDTVYLVRLLTGRLDDPDLTALVLRS
jgi:hypothetical protein